MTAKEVARWFLLRNDIEADFGDTDLITHLKLQKLLYYAQGIALAVFGKPIFDEDILAWKHGPVVLSVYEEYKECGSDPIEVIRTEDDDRILEAMEADESNRNVLEATFTNYGKYSAWHLRNMTHDERPWKETALNDVISKELIKKFFRDEVIEYED